MGRKSAKPAVARQQGIEDYLRRLDRHDAQEQQAQINDVEQLKEAWQPRVTIARTLLEQITATKASYGPTVDALAERDYAHVPPSAPNLNIIAQIERTIAELSQVWEHSTQGLQRVITAHEALSPKTVHSFRANAPIYEDYLRFYRHTPAGIGTLWNQLQHHLQVLATRLESASDAEVFAPLPKLPEPEPPAPEVEMA